MAEGRATPPSRAGRPPLPLPPLRGGENFRGVGALDVAVGDPGARAAPHAGTRCRGGCRGCSGRRVGRVAPLRGRGQGREVRGARRDRRAGAPPAARGGRPGPAGPGGDALRGAGHGPGRRTAEPVGAGPPPSPGSRIPPEDAGARLTGRRAGPPPGPAARPPLDLRAGSPPPDDGEAGRPGPSAHPAGLPDLPGRAGSAAAAPARAAAPSLRPPPPPRTSSTPYILHPVQDPASSLGEGLAPARLARTDRRPGRNPPPGRGRRRWVPRGPGRRRRRQGGGRGGGGVPGGLGRVARGEDGRVPSAPGLQRGRRCASAHLLRRPYKVGRRRGRFVRRAAAGNFCPQSGAQDL